ncbi:MAG: FKBP-type peptidyl-prolyl cis-trans isomerase [Erythrobacter sp.]|nr:FKBP-type peptidyl-prolyl cis-trans isomerase [Erythrobacter sp.]
MAEVTRVPLQPIAKGSLTKLWLGVLAAILVAAGIAWAAMPKGLDVDVVEAGSGDFPTEDSVVWVHYTGKLADGTVFDQSQDPQIPIEGIFPEGTPLPLSEMIPGMRDALMQTQVGGKYEIFIPAAQAYGEDVPEGGPIPPNSDLYFEVEVTAIMTQEDFQAKIAQFQQQMMQQQLDGAGAGGAAEGGAAAGGAAPAQ